MKHQGSKDRATGWKKHREPSQPQSLPHPHLAFSSTWQIPQKVLALRTFMEFQVKILPVLGSPLSLLKETLLFL